MMYIFRRLLLLVVLVLVPAQAKLSAKKNGLEEVTDFKDFKKILRTKNNVLVLFFNSAKQSQLILRTFEEAAEKVRGQGTMLTVECSGETKKMCKKLKVAPEPHTIRHYKDGEFHKVYDRKETAGSIVNFMRDPTGDVPWDEDDSLGDVVHVPDLMGLAKLMKRESRPIMVMFYAPWCGFCKQMKPEYSAAAAELKGTAVLAAMDVNRPENAAVRTNFNITGFPTLLYFKDGVVEHVYEGENKKDAIVKFMRDPTEAPVKPKEEDWAEQENDVTHLTDENFDSVIESEESVLVMFYAPWCGHCKKMKPQYDKAAQIVKSSNIKGVIAALDATKHTATAKKFNVKGYPSIKYFKNGESLWDVSLLRDSDKIVEFMKSPSEPPPPPPPEPEWETIPSEIVHLNTENFKTILRKKKHALVMFYAPWCGHCKQTKPEYTAAAEEFKDNSRVTLAALDCTKHGSVCKAIGIEGYPTFKYYQYYDKLKKDYQGGRLKSNFVEFMNLMDEPVKADSRIPSNWNSVTQLTDSTFNAALQKYKSLLVFFYDDSEASSSIRTEFAEAASAANPKNEGYLASMDALKNKKTLKELNLTKFPIIKYFRGGKFDETYSRPATSKQILTFLRQKMSKSKDEL